MKLKLASIIKPQETLNPAVHKHEAILLRKQKDADQSHMLWLIYEKAFGW